VKIGNAMLSSEMIFLLADYKSNNCHSETAGLIQISVLIEGIKVKFKTAHLLLCVANYFE